MKPFSGEWGTRWCCECLWIKTQLFDCYRYRRAPPFLLYNGSVWSGQQSPSERNRMKSLLLSPHLIILLQSMASVGKESTIFHNNFIILAVSGKWKLITSWFAWGELFKLMQACRYQRITGRLVDGWTSKQQHGIALKGSVFPPSDCGCGFINLRLPPLSDMLYSCSMLDLFESDCTLSEETDHVELSCAAAAGWALDPHVVRLEH